MGIRCDKMDQPFFEQLLRKPLDLASETSCKTHSSHLAETTHPDHFIVTLGSSGNLQIPLRMADNSNNPPCHQLEENFLCSDRDGVQWKFKHEKSLSITNCHDLFLIQLMKDLIGEMDIGTGKYFKFGVRSSELGVTTNQSIIQFFNLSEDCGSIILILSIKSMGGGYNCPHSISVTDPAHLDRFVHCFRTVVESMKDVIMKIDHTLPGSARSSPRAGSH